MNDTDSILTHEDGPLTVLRLNRPRKCNALDGEMMRQLTAFFEDPGVLRSRAVVLSAIGPDFCSGVDLDWMKQCDESDTSKSSMTLVRLYAAMRAFPRPIVARVFGRVVAGGVGIAAACDLVFAPTDARFSIPETRVGLVPALMAPPIVERIGVSRFRELSLTGRTFDCREAHAFGLVDFIESADERLTFDHVLGELLKGGPRAQASVKTICRELLPRPWHSQAEVLSSILAEARGGSEAREGICAFFERRLPEWREG